MGLRRLGRFESGGFVCVAEDTGAEDTGAVDIDGAFASRKHASNCKRRTRCGIVELVTYRVPGQEYRRCCRSVAEGILDTPAASLAIVQSYRWRTMAAPWPLKTAANEIGGTVPHHSIDTVTPTHTKRTATDMKHKPEGDLGASEFEYHQCTSIFALRHFSRTSDDRDYALQLVRGTSIIMSMHSIPSS